MSEEAVIWSGEHRAYWREGACGYTFDIAKAGRWAADDARSMTSHCGPEKQIEIRPARSVADYPDAKLLGSVMRALAYSYNTPRAGYGWTMREQVMHTFALGSTYAGQLCERFGFDPDKRVRKRR